ncbi:hypothetical protein LLEC1_07337, partial [Akanthomyces lecanii]
HQNGLCKGLLARSPSSPDQYPINRVPAHQSFFTSTRQRFLQKLAVFTPTEHRQMSSPSSISDQVPVSNVQKRKRRNTYDTTEDSPPAKRIKSTSATREASNFPPQFWDNLSKVWLTPRALREKDRRNGGQPRVATSTTPVTVTPTTLARFARRGGPDLRHLRGYPESKHTVRMSPDRASASSSRRTRSTKATTVPSKAKRSSAYDKDFEQNLIDHGIYPEGFEHTDGRSTPEPKNLDDIVRDIAHPRASLSPSQFSASAFKSFKLANSRVISEGKVMADILPILRGNTDIPNEGNLPFTNLVSITNGMNVDAVPDLYDGSHAKDISKAVRQNLCETIIPTSHARAPVAPNFFVEAKAPRGGADVAKRQACLDGALGARAMHSLRTYGEEEPSYDGNAHTFSSTYHDGTLKMYAHHVTGPTPEYHMTQIDSWGVSGNIDTFRRGATALRNARDLARRQRGTLIQAANARSSEAGLATVTGNTDQTYEGTWHDSHDDLQQHIAESYVEEHEDCGEAIATPRHHYDLDESEDVGQESAALVTDGPSMSFVSSFTTVSTDTTRPKRPRPSFSSPTQETPFSKSRSRSTAIDGSMDSTKNPGSSDSSVSSSIETRLRHGKSVCGTRQGKKSNRVQ